MRSITRVSCLALSLLAANIALADSNDPSFDLALTALADQNGSSSYDANLTLTPNTRWSLSAGGGSSSADSNAASLHGDSFNLDADWHPGNFGVRPGYSHWSDNDSFTSSTPELTLYWKHEGLELKVLAEQPKSAIDYQVRVLAQTVTRHFEYSGTGLGAGISWYGPQWGGYLSGTSYSYGDEITRLRAASQSAGLQRFPRLSLLVQSMATLSEGSVKNRWTAGVERDFLRVAIHGDLIRVIDALTGTQADSYGLGANFLVNKRLSIDATGGVNHAEGVSDASFASVTFTLHW